MTKQRYPRQEHVRVLKLYERPCTIAVRIRLRKLRMGPANVGVWNDESIRLPGAVHCVASLRWVGQHALAHMGRYWRMPAPQPRIMAAWWGAVCKNS